MKKYIKQFDSHKIFSRRSAILIGGKLFLTGGLIARLGYLGGYKAKDYQTLADDNRVKLNILLPKRGRILDINGKVLADNHKNYSLVITPEHCTNYKETLKNVQKIYPLSDESVERICKEIKHKPRFINTTVIENLSWDNVCQFEILSPDLAGIEVEEGYTRTYPFKQETGHLIGYVQVPSQKEASQSPVYRLPGARVGKCGIEKQFQDTLKGTPGYKEVEVNARRRVVRDLSCQDSLSGNDLHLTLDQELQSYVGQQLSTQESACAIVMDIRTGNVLSFVSHPSFDNNLFVNGISEKNWGFLRDHPRRALINKGMDGLYSPGSIFKMVVALAGLKAGYINEHTEFHCKGHIEVGNHRFHCWKKYGGHGKTNLVKALRESCDVYFYELAKTLGIEKIAEMARLFSIGEKTGIDLPQERSGLMPTKDWKKRVMKQNWHVGDTILASIGQGATLATPLQMVTMGARLVGNGLTVKPRILYTPETPSFDPMPIPISHLALIQKGFNQGVNHPAGLAYKSRIVEPGYEMGGKTGTTQVRRISMKERKKGVLRNEQLPWKHRDHAMYLGYAPIHNPRYAACVVVEHGGGGGRVAAPIARNILLKTQRLRGRT